MKDISTPVPSDEFQAEMRKCLKQAALVNYTKVSSFVKIEGELGKGGGLVNNRERSLEAGKYSTFKIFEYR